MKTIPTLEEQYPDAFGNGEGKECQSDFNMGGWLCTRPDGHGGNHAAAGYHDVFVVWRPGFGVHEKQP